MGSIKCPPNMFLEPHTHVCMLCTYLCHPRHNTPEECDQLCPDYTVGITTQATSQKSPIDNSPSGSVTPITTLSVTCFVILVLCCVCLLIFLQDENKVVNGRYAALWGKPRIQHSKTQMTNTREGKSRSHPIKYHDDLLVTNEEKGFPIKQKKDQTTLTVNKGQRSLKQGVVEEDFEVNGQGPKYQKDKTDIASVHITPSHNKNASVSIHTDGFGTKKPEEHSLDHDQHTNPKLRSARWDLDPCSSISERGGDTSIYNFMTFDVQGNSFVSSDHVLRHTIQSSSNWDNIMAVYTHIEGQLTRFRWIIGCTLCNDYVEVAVSLDGTSLDVDLAYDRLCVGLSPELQTFLKVSVDDNMSQAYK